LVLSNLGKITVGCGKNRNELKNLNAEQVRKGACPRCYLGSNDPIQAAAGACPLPDLLGFNAPADSQLLYRCDRRQRNQCED